MQVPVVSSAINLSKLDFKFDGLNVHCCLMDAINLSKLDFKCNSRHYNKLKRSAINLSKLDFKYVDRFLIQFHQINYKSIQTGF